MEKPECTQKDVIARQSSQIGRIFASLDEQHRKIDVIQTKLNGNLEHIKETTNEIKKQLDKVFDPEKGLFMQTKDMQARQDRMEITQRRNTAYFWTLIIGVPSALFAFFVLMSKS